MQSHATRVFLYFKLKCKKENIIIKKQASGKSPASFYSLITFEENGFGESVIPRQDCAS